MRLLLDTHIWLWSLLEPTQLTAHVARALEDPANDLWLSPVSTWELLVLIDRGRVVLNVEPATWIRSVLGIRRFKEALLSHEVAVQSHLVDLPHRDPVDRFLAATARVYELTLVTADERLLGSQMYAVLANR